MSNTYSHVSEVAPNILTGKHIRSDYLLFKTGLAADRPTEGNSQTSGYLSSDSNILSYWNKNSKTWVEVALT